ncbi:MAG TPA: hypothetical protein VGH28_22100 [Polyangiaceae bacterium]
MRISWLSVFLFACSAAPVDVEVADASDDVVLPDAPELEAAAPEPEPDAGAEAAAPDPCAKHITVLFAVGTGAGALKSHATSCYTVLDADGAANKQFRKCSTSNFAVSNASAPNYAFDDTNPNAPLSEDQNFLQQCAAGATGDGFEYMAYRGSWRLIFPANHLKAFFAELHAGDGDVDDNWPSAYVNNAELAKHTVYPMINIGPTNVSNPAPTIQKDGLAICKTVKDGGYFGVYVGTWNQPMTQNDARIVALANAMNACTKK